MPCSVRLAFRHWLGLQILNLPNRRVRTRTHGGVGGGSCEASPYPDKLKSQKKHCCPERRTPRSRPHAALDFRLKEIALRFTLSGALPELRPTPRLPQQHFPSFAWLQFITELAVALSRLTTYRPKFETPAGLSCRRMPESPAGRLDGDRADSLDRTVRTKLEEHEQNRRRPEL